MLTPLGLFGSKLYQRILKPVFCFGSLASKLFSINAFILALCTKSPLNGSLNPLNRLIYRVFCFQAIPINPKRPQSF
jgi:hypothetical protein